VRVPESVSTINGMKRIAESGPFHKSTLMVYFWRRKEEKLSEGEES
jgi:hypothetical protein